MRLHPDLKNSLPLPVLAAALLAATAGTTSAQTLVVNDISLTGDSGFSLTVPTVEAVDANLDEAEIRAIFAGDFASADLAGLDAARISIPEIVFTAEFEDAEGVTRRSVITYRDIELTDVSDGVAAAPAVGAPELDGDE